MTKIRKKNIDFDNCVCYNASRQKDESVQLTHKNPRAATLGFFIPFLERWLVPLADYRLLSLSSHLHM